MREDYSPDGDAWNYFSHDQARSRAYRWGEDGIAGICDDRQRLCLALALWNGADPILKERMFGLTNGEGNHGEDVKEYWFYLDSTPTHSYLKCQYKYPQRAFPYEDLVATNGRRGKQDLEYELLDTGIFDEDRYFDVVVEYAKAAPDDILMLVTAHNRGPEPATLHLLPTLWFRNTWSGGGARPSLSAQTGGVRASHPDLGEWALHTDAAICCSARTRRTTTARRRHAKDGIGDFVVHGAQDAVNPAGTGTKVAAHHVLRDPGGRQRVDPRPPAAPRRPTGSFDAVMDARREEADALLRDGHPRHARRRRRARDAPGARRPAVEQAVLRVRRPPLAARARRQPVGRQRGAGRRPQRAVVPHGRRRRHLDAGQVGVPVVRGVGPGLPLRAALARRRRLRQAAGRAAAAAPATCTPTARSRPTSGTSATSTRP